MRCLTIPQLHVEMSEDAGISYTMLDFRVKASTWLMAIFMMLSCVSPAKAKASEAYSHYSTSTTFYSSINYLKCTFDQQVTVTSTEEISDLIKLYTHCEKSLKIRATHPGSHSGMGFVCSGKRGSSYAEHHDVDIHSDRKTSVTVLLHLLNRIVEADRERHQLTVEAGMTLRGLTLAAEENAMAVPPGALSMYANLTVAGVIMSSAHGSGYRTTSSLGDLVRKVKWVDARGKIIVSDVETQHGAKEVRALVGGLGLLGIVTEITLQLQPNSRTIVEIRKDVSDSNMVTELRKILEEETPHVITFWRPDFGTYRALLWTQVEGGYDPATMPEFYPNGSMAVEFAIPEQAAIATKELMAAWENDVKDESPSADVLNAGICALSNATVDAFVPDTGNGTLINRATLPTNFAMVSADCAPNCSFNVHYAGIFTEDEEFTIKLSDLEDWVKDVKRVVRTEIAEVEARLSKRYGEGRVKRCSPGIFVLRFGQGNQNLLSTSTGSEDVVYVQMDNVHSALIANKLSKVSTITETVEQLTLCKYKGRPHWGKNHERVVRHPECKVRDHYPAANIAELLEMREQHDPRKVFEPELFRKVMQKRGPDYSPLCTPHYWCYCAADSHCPSGFHCRGSDSFPEYKICGLTI